MAFYFGALNAWDDDEKRWTTSEERDSSLNTAQSLLLERERLSDLTPAQIVSVPFLVGYYDGILWMENDAPRAE